MTVPNKSVQMPMKISVKMSLIQEGHLVSYSYSYIHTKDAPHLIACRIGTLLYESWHTAQKSHQTMCQLPTIKGSDIPYRNKTAMKETISAKIF
jgi:hypothetical protein